MSNPHASQRLDLGGKRIRAGDIITSSLVTSDRAEALVADHLKRFDISRKPVAQVEFGHGVHQCIGRQLAGLEMQIALFGLLRRFPGFQLAVPFGEVDYRRESTVDGVREFPVAW